MLYKQTINKKSEYGKSNIISRDGELAITRDSQFQITAFCSFDARGYVTAFFQAVQEVPLNATGFNYYQYSLRLYKSDSYSHYFKLVFTMLMNTCCYSTSLKMVQSQMFVLLTLLKTIKNLNRKSG